MNMRSGQFADAARRISEHSAFAPFLIVAACAICAANAFGLLP